MARRIQLRRDTAANWTSTNPVLAQGEIGIDLTSSKIKIGNGSTLWNALSYWDDQDTDTGSWTFDTVTATTVGNIIVKAGSGADAWASLLSNNGANSFWVDDVGAHVTSNFVEGETTENYWTFGTDGSLTFPDATVQSTAWTGITGFGEGFSLTAADTIVTNKLYSTNLTQPTQHYRLELDTNGVIILPDQSIINGATLKTVPGNYAGITAGPASPAGKDEDSWVWVDNDGATIATKYSTDNYQWKFNNTGALVYPRNALQRDTATVECLGNTSTVVYTASGQYQHTIKLLIQVEGFEASETINWDTQACEMIIAKSFSPGNDIAATVYGVVHTSVAPLATFTANWNALTSRVEVLCTTASANDVYVRTFATEINTAD